MSADKHMAKRIEGGADSTPEVEVEPSDIGHVALEGTKSVTKRPAFGALMAIAGGLITYEPKYVSSPETEEPAQTPVTESGDTDAS